MLWMIDIQGDTRALKELLRRHPQQLLSDWLSELEQLGFIRSVPTRVDIDRTIPLDLTELALAAGADAAKALSLAGAYLAENRPVRGTTSRPRDKTVVLIVEDDPDQLALANLRVSNAGYQVRMAASVQELTRSLVEQGAPDLLILDVMLPDGNGFDVLAKLRRHPQFSEIGIILLTVKQEAADIARGLALGADGYVTKPYSQNVLVGVISGVLESPPAVSASTASC
jgi:two-component system, OmpR family, response regulator